MMIFTPTPLQKATAVKPWMNAAILSRKRETDKATPVKVWRFTLVFPTIICIIAELFLKKNIYRQGYKNE